MDTHGIILVVIAGLELLLGIYLYFSRVHSHIVYSFCLLILGIVFWVFGNGMYRLAETNINSLWWVDLSHFSAGIIGVALVYFSYAFPYQSVRFKPHLILALTLPLIVLAYLIFGTNTLITEVVGKVPSRIEVVGPTYTIFAVWFLAYGAWAFTNLIRKYRAAAGAPKRLMKLTLIGIAASFMIGTLFNLIFPWFGGPQLFFVGTESSVIWLSFTSYIVFSNG